MLPSTYAVATAEQEKAEELMALGEANLLDILKSPTATEFARAKACQRLAVVGTKASVPVLAAMLSDQKFAHYARFGLEPIPDASVDDALRQALGKLSGRLQVGVISSIGQRRDSRAVEALANCLDDSNAEVAAAAAAALAKIGDPQAAKVLQKAVDYTRSVAGACLECCERLLAEGNKDQALALYDALLLRSDLPEAVQLAATGAVKAIRR